MRFHLTYEGMLYGASRATHKQEIRKVFHQQLQRLWLDTWLKDMNYGSWSDSGFDPNIPLQDALAQLYTRGRYRFVPLVREQFSLLCSLDIIFLRPGIPGSIVRSADIDNRLKTLFDALRMPVNEPELGNYTSPDAGQDPFFCLLEDDKLISHVSVATDMMLGSVEGGFDDNAAHIIIDVKISPYRMTWANIGFAS
jgi:hypothetical protein